MNRSRDVWLFNSAQFSGNPKWLMIYVANHHPEITAYWLADNASVHRQVEAAGFAAVTLGSREARDVMAKTGVFVVNQVKEVIPEALRGATLLNLWHGVGVKGIERGMNEGYLRERIAKKYIVNNQAYRDRQLFLVTSPMMERHFSRYIGLDDDVIIRGGYPQSVYPLTHPGFASFDHDVRGRKGLPPHTRLALYAPTPRREASQTFLDAALPDPPRLNAALAAADTLLLVKMHPHMTTDPSFVRLRAEHGDLSHILFWDNAEDVYEIAPQIDVAIMDYSSILYDLLAAGTRRFIRYIFDYSDGNAVLQGGELDYLTLSCGTIARDFDELVDAIGQDNTVPADEADRLMELFWEYSTPESLEHIVSRALEFTPRHVDLPTLYSYDVFDTVFHRVGVEPISVFAYVQQRLSAEPAGYPQHLIADFPRVRQHAERIARQNRRARAELVESGELEVTIADIYDRLSAVYGLTPAQVAQLIAWECECEVQGTLPNKPVIDELLAHRAAGDTVVLISDMYLPETTVRQMLVHADPRLSDIPLYLSNTWQAQKTTKKLFLAVYDDLGYDFAAWIHTGDNQLADVARPKSLGIETRKLETPTLNKQEQRLVDRCGTYDAYLVAGLLRDLRVQSALTATELFVARHVAFYLIPYIDWVLSDAAARGYRQLWFISRDGYHMRRIADALIRARSLDIETGYIYGSRQAWRLASMVDDIDDDYFSGHGNLAGASTPEQLLDAAELTAHEFRALFPEHVSLLTQAKISRAELSAVRESMQRSHSYRERLLELAAHQRATMVDYLRQEVDFDTPHAFVEYWGRGYTQDCLARVLQTAPDTAGPVPFYYARSIYPTEGMSVRHNFTSSDHSLLFIEAIFANLPHSTVLGYQRVDGRVEPVFEPRAHDEELRLAMESILPAFAGRYAELPVLDRDRLDRDIFEFGFEHFTQKPDSKVYREHLAHLRDAVTMGGAEREFAPAIGFRDYVNHLRGERLNQQTTSLPLSLSRSSSAIRFLHRMQQEVGFRRPIKRFRSRVRRWQRRRRGI